ncbi:MAG: 4-alpha-glucanotransferase [Pseudomonadota bacterium]
MNESSFASNAPNMDLTALAELADTAGVAREWIDAAGNRKIVATDSLQAVLGALGLACDTAHQCLESRAGLLAFQTAGRLPPLITATCGTPERLPLPAATVGMPYRIELEQGGVITGVIASDDSGLPCHTAIEQAGYHRLFIGDESTIVAVAPTRCFSIDDAVAASTTTSGTAAASGAPAAARCWGLGVQLYSLRRPGDGGIGDFTALNVLTHRAAAEGASTVAISPVHAMFSADTLRYSPYGPSSRLFLNALHIDPAAVYGPEALSAALATLDVETRTELARVEQELLIDWPVAGRIRLRLLRALFDQNLVSAELGAESDAEFKSFCQRGGEALKDHARFEMLHALQLQQGGAGDWRLWPANLQNPRSENIAALAATHRHEVDFHLFLQWQAAKGLANAQASARQAGMPIGLIADLAIGADRGGSQAWSRQTQMINGLSVGAPPDIINTRGQDWGLGAFSPHAMKAQGFTAYIEMLRAVFAHCGGVRIDHVLGLARLWLVPDGRPSSEGAYLQYPLEDLLRLIALESHRHRAIVIGEDLGTVPAGFDTRLASAALLGIRVLYFERDHNGFKKPSWWSNQAMATTTTHDLPTVAGWWAGHDLDWRAKLELLAPNQSLEQAHAERAQEREQLWHAFTRDGATTAPMPTPTDTAEVVDAAIAYVGDTPAPLVILPIEDALGLDQQPNLPGTVDTHPNWRRRLPQPVAMLFDDPRTRQRLALLSGTRNPPKVF